MFAWTTFPEALLFLLLHNTMISVIIVYVYVIIVFIAILLYFLLFIVITFIIFFMCTRPKSSSDVTRYAEAPLGLSRATVEPEGSSAFSDDRTNR